MNRPGQTLALGYLAAVLLLGAGCGPSGDPPSDSDPSESQVDALRALPYASFSDDEADPDQEGVTRHDPSRAEPGYNLYTLRPLCAAELVDMSGALLHRWSGESCKTWNRSVLLPNGDLLVVGDDLRGPFLMRLDWSGEIVWKQDLEAHHDVEVTPANVLLVLTHDVRPAMVDGREARIRDDYLTLLDQSGALLERRSLFDLITAEHADVLEWVRPREGHLSSDLLHSNSAEWMDQEHLFGTDALYADNHVLVSFRHQDMVAIFDWDEEQMVWWWGKGELLGPHDATLLESGSILIFDNGLGRDWSRLVEVDPRTDEIVWEYRAEEPESFYSGALGAAQRLSNGNTLVAHSSRGRAFEVTPDGDIVWEFFVPHLKEEGGRVPIVRIKRYAEGSWARSGSN